MTNLQLVQFYNQLPFPLTSNCQPPIIAGSSSTSLQQVSPNLTHFCSHLICFVAYLIHMCWRILTKCWHSIKQNKQLKISQPHHAIEIIIIKDIIVNMQLLLTDSQLRWITLVGDIIIFW